MSKLGNAAQWYHRHLSQGPNHQPGSAVRAQDPGNWATDLEGGAQFGYTLLVVVLLSNMLAIFLQSLSLRLGIVSERDLAQACRDAYPKARPTYPPRPRKGQPSAVSWVLLISSRALNLAKVNMGLLHCWPHSVLAQPDFMVREKLAHRCVPAACVPGRLLLTANV